MLVSVYACTCIEYIGILMFWYKQKTVVQLCHILGKKARVENVERGTRSTIQSATNHNHHYIDESIRWIRGGPVWYGTYMIWQD